MSEPYAINIMLQHHSVSAASVLNEIGLYFDNDTLSKDSEWGVIECKELLRVPEQFAMFVSIWEFRFNSKLEYQKYKLSNPEKYRELSQYTHQYDEDYERIVNNPNTERVELRISEATDEKYRFIYEDPEL